MATGSDGSRTHERIGEGLHHGRPLGRGAPLVSDGRMGTTATTYWSSPIAGHAVLTRPETASSSSFCTERCSSPASPGRRHGRGLAQEALARTLVRWRRVRRGTNPAGYVYCVSFRLLARRWRRQKPAHLAADEWQVPGPEGEATTRVPSSRSSTPCRLGDGWSPPCVWSSAAPPPKPRRRSGSPRARCASTSRRRGPPSWHG
jgi:hypothetical protein